MVFYKHNDTKGGQWKKGSKGEPERVINFPNISSEDV